MDSGENRQEIELDEEDIPLDTTTPYARHFRPETTLLRSEYSEFTLCRNQREERRLQTEYRNLDLASRVASTDIELQRKALVRSMLRTRRVTSCPATDFRSRHQRQPQPQLKEQPPRLATENSVTGNGYNEDESHELAPRDNVTLEQRRLTCRQPPQRSRSFHLSIGTLAEVDDEDVDEKILSGSRSHKATVHGRVGIQQVRTAPLQQKRSPLRKQQTVDDLYDDEQDDDIGALNSSRSKGFHDARVGINRLSRSLTFCGSTRCSNDVDEGGSGSKRSTNQANLKSLPDERNEDGGDGAEVAQRKQRQQPLKLGGGRIAERQRCPFRAMRSLSLQSDLDQCGRSQLLFGVVQPDAVRSTTSSVPAVAVQIDQGVDGLNHYLDQRIDHSTCHDASGNSAVKDNMQSTSSVQPSRQPKSGIDARSRKNQSRPVNGACDGATSVDAVRTSRIPVISYSKPVEAQTKCLGAVKFNKFDGRPSGTRFSDISSENDRGKVVSDQADNRHQNSTNSNALNDARLEKTSGSVNSRQQNGDDQSKCAPTHETPATTNVHTERTLPSNEAVEDRFCRAVAGKAGGSKLLLRTAHIRPSLSPHAVRAAVEADGFVKIKRFYRFPPVDPSLQPSSVKSDDVEDKSETLPPWPSVLATKLTPTSTAAIKRCQQAMGSSSMSNRTCSKRGLTTLPNGVAGRCGRGSRGRRGRPLTFVAPAAGNK